MKTSALVLFGLCLLTVGRTDASKAVDQQVYRYRCDNGFVLEVVYGKAADGNGTARITVDGESRLLRQGRAASGARYVADGWGWWSKGQEGVLQQATPGRRDRCVQLVDN